MNTSDEVSSATSKHKLYAIIGGILLVIGVFAPVGKAFWVEIDYFLDGEGDGVIVLAALVITAPILLMRRYQRALWIPALIIAGTVGYDFLNIYTELGADTMAWGWIPLLIGSGFMLAAAATAK
ncbi:MAG: hypothetical protein GXY36_13250 [Chloroflexi bacterium]|nr:hypothetical protein [Chloroflexota bacterium]